MSILPDKLQYNTVELGLMSDVTQAFDLKGIEVAVR